MVTWILINQPIKWTAKRYIFFSQLTLVVRDDLTTDKWWFDGKYPVLFGCELVKNVI